MRAAKGEGSMSKTDKGWRGYVTVAGKRKYTRYHKTKALCAQEKRELLNRRDDGKLVAGKVPTVAAWMDHWLENVAKHRPTTYAMDRWVTDSKIVPELGSIKLDKLTTERLEEWVTSLNVAASSQRRYLAPLKSALNVALDRGQIGFNPALRVKLDPIGKPNTTAFSREDRDAILTAATGRNRARWHLAVKLGLRPAEVLGLTWQDFDDKTGALAVSHQLLRVKGLGFIYQDAPKSEAGERRIILPKTIAALLRTHRTEQLLLMAEMGAEWKGWEYDGRPVALMFPQPNGGPIGPGVDTKAWRALLMSAGLSETRRYQSRHTAATHMIADSGGDVAVTAKILGHADAAFTYRVYVHPLEEREQALMAKMDEPSAPYVAPYGDYPSEHERTVEASDR
ncbi:MULTISPECIES: tyrosine-type recombinase/integrase [Cryobacterium]|nr:MULTISPECIES: tyrosine-type recombinase/integrase [Cryobacterium]